MSGLARRDLLAGAVAASVLGAVPARAAHLKRIGIQTYSLRQLFTADPFATLTRLRQTGYDEVELSGLALDEGKARAIRRHADHIGLGLASAHFERRDLRDRPDAVIATANALDLRYVVLPWINVEDRRTLDQWHAIAHSTNAIGARVKAAGMTFAYHNHDFEFERIDGQIPYDLFVRETDPDLVKLELHLSLAIKGGLDVPAFIAAHPDRVALVHISMTTDGAVVNPGEGRNDLAAILKSCARAGFQHYFIEHDELLAPYWPGAEASLRNLRALTI